MKKAFAVMEVLFAIFQNCQREKMAAEEILGGQDAFS